MGRTQKMPEAMETREKNYWKVFSRAAADFVRQLKIDILEKEVAR